MTRLSLSPRLDRPAPRLIVRWFVALSVIVSVMPHLQAQESREPRYFNERTGIQTGPDTPVSEMAKQLPFAYYPSLRLLEVAFDLAGVKERDAKFNLTPAQVRSVTVRVLPQSSDSPVAEGTIALNSKGMGTGTIQLPELSDGEYRVEYQVGTFRIAASQTFPHKTFPWVSNELGMDHTVYPPFVPVQVSNAKVEVVDRTYTVNTTGTFDSVIAKGQELLAGPMQLTVTSAGNAVTWRDGKVSGKVMADDLAVFEASVQSDVVNLSARTSVEEDGCATIDWTLMPAKSGARIDAAFLDIPLRDEQVPLFHYVYENAHRHNYAGNTPRGGKIVWDLTSQFWTPVIWHAEPGPSDGSIWNSLQIKQWNNGDKEASWPFVPYIWLGSEHRGLSWFAENDAGASLSRTKPAQEVIRQGERVILRVHVVNDPITLNGPRRIRFGMQASPTKPMEPEWRSRAITTGVGPVVCWGGYLCSSKYPDGHDFTIVDKIQEARKTGKVDEEWFRKRDERRSERGRKVLDREAWIDDVLRTARDAAWRKEPGGTYFEEHAYDVSDVEWSVYRDEWSNKEFDRFQKQTANWGTFPRSATDFRLYYANEWMKRGVSLYFDNVNPKRDFNPVWSNAYRMNSGTVRYSVPLWDQRSYYKRMWKLAQSFNAKGANPRIDLTFHMTNTQVIPHNTWCSAVLDFEQKYRTDDKGVDLPWPTDYLRAESIGVMVGAIPYALDPIRNGSHREFYSQKSPQEILSNWGMMRTHEMRGEGSYHERSWLANGYQEVFSGFGYGKPQVKVHNYWDAQPVVEVSDANVKWIALQRESQPAGLLVLQSYSQQPVSVKVRWPIATIAVDLQTRSVLRADDQGRFTVAMDRDYGTRLLVVADREEALPGAAMAASETGVLLADDFELSMKPQWAATAAPEGARQGAMVRTMPEGIGAGRALRLSGGSRLVGITPRFVENTHVRDQELSLKFRVAALPAGRPGPGLFTIEYAHANKPAADKPADTAFAVTLDVDRTRNVPAWIVHGPSPLRKGDATAWREIRVNNTSNATGKAETAPSVGRADTAWHHLKIRVLGQRHRIWVDEQLVFDADAPMESTGPFTISTGWRINDMPGAASNKWIELDDVVWRALDASGG